MRQISITSDEINKGKFMAGLAYSFFYIPLIRQQNRTNKYIMFHTEQAIVLQIFGFVLLIFSILSFGFGGLIALPTYIVYFIIGKINAKGGSIKQLPLIGQFGEKFNLVK